MVRRVVETRHIGGDRLIAFPRATYPLTPEWTGSQGLLTWQAVELVSSADVSFPVLKHNGGADGPNARLADLFGAALRLFLLPILFVLGIILGWCGHAAFDGRARTKSDEGRPVRADDYASLPVNPSKTNDHGVNTTS